jgi:hypothetical protein
MCLDSARCFKSELNNSIKKGLPDDREAFSFESVDLLTL